MSLPVITANIGEQLSKEAENEFTAIIKDIKAVKEKDVPYIVFLTFDLPRDIIHIELNKKYNKDAVNNYFYFGNNSAAAAQYHLTREGNSIKYLLLSAFSDLYNKLKSNDMEDSELGKIIMELSNRNLIMISDKKGEGKLNLNKLSIMKNKKIKNIKIRGKGEIIVNDKKINADTFIRLFIEDENKSNKFVLVVPKVIQDDSAEIILSKHHDYLELAKIENKLTESTVEGKGSKKVCYICKQNKLDVNSKYTTDFSRTGINKIFTTKTKNYSPFLKNYNYDENYSMCNSCYQNLLYGEKIIEEQFKGKIAGENVFIVPEALLTILEYKYINSLKNAADLAFKSKNAIAWLEEIELATLDLENYLVNFIIYRTDGNSVTILETIEDVPMLRLEHVMKAFDRNCIVTDSNLYEMSLGMVYRIIPVKTNKSKEQIDIGRVLSFYKALLSANKINHKILYKYASEALDKGLKQLNKSRIDNYFNLNLTKYIGYEDYFIKSLIFRYISLIRTCQELDLLDKNIFNAIEKEGKILDASIETSWKDTTFIDKAEKFLKEQGFNDNESALFYLGILINRVAIAQYQKEHKKKPILKKIQFQGMNKKDIYRLYNDVTEKLIQYDKMTLFTESIIKKFHSYFGSIEKESTLDDHANIFYLMAGYSFMVGTKPPDLSKDEEVQEEIL